MDSYEISENEDGTFEVVIENQIFKDLNENQLFALLSK